MAKFFDWKVIVILALLIWIVVQTCTAPPKYDPAADIYQDSVKTLKKEKAIISSRIASIVETARNKEVQDSVKLAASLKEIARLKVKANQAVDRIPVRVMEENPEIGLALQAKDEVIQEQGILIDTLQAQLKFERGVRENLVQLHYDEGKITTNMLELKDKRIVSLEKDLKKEKRKGRGLKALVVAVGVLGVLVGSNL